MPTLNVQNFDAELLRLAKSTAALRGVTIKAFIEGTLAKALGVEVSNAPKTKKQKRIVPNQ